MFKTDIFNEIFVKNPSGEKYYIINNGYKVWIIPHKEMKKGYGIYQVSSFRGKLVKNVLPRLKNVRFIRKIAKCKAVRLNLNENIKSVIEKYCDGNYYCSVYYGNLDSEQNFKATVQVYNNCETLFYIKITKSEIVKKAIDKEIIRLDKMHKKGINNIPNCLGMHCQGEWTFFVQDTRNGKRQNTFEFEDYHWKFLETMYERSKCIAGYRESDIYKYIEYLKKQCETNTQLDRYKIVYQGIEQAERWLSVENRTYSFAHGDFTPWNMYYVHGDIYVFDFEYCMDKAIPFMDYFHYICQTRIIVNNMNEQRTLKEYRKNKDRLLKFLDNPDMAFVTYLLFIISFYFMRRDGKYDTDNKQFKFRIGLLSQLLKKED